MVLAKLIVQWFRENKNCLLLTVGLTYLHFTNFSLYTMSTKGQIRMIGTKNLIAFLVINGPVEIGDD